MTKRFFSSLCLALAASSASLLAGPGVAIALDASARGLVGGQNAYLGTDENFAATIIQSHCPHVTLIHFEADRNVKLAEDEVNQFLKGVAPLFPEMIANAMAECGLQGGRVKFMNSTYSGNLFNRGIKGYQAGPVSTKIFKVLNRQLNEYFNGTWQSDKTEAPVPIAPFNVIKVSHNSTLQNYEPHMTTTGPSCYFGTNQPVQSLTVIMDQGLTPHWHRDGKAK